jgi:hypothetical protein
MHARRHGFEFCNRPRLDHAYAYTLYLATLAPTTTKVDFHGGFHIKNITKNIKRKETKSTTICTLSKASVIHDGVSQIKILTESRLGNVINIENFVLYNF